MRRLKLAGIIAAGVFVSCIVLSILVVAWDNSTGGPPRRATATALARESAPQIAASAPTAAPVPPTATTAPDPTATPEPVAEPTPTEAPVVAAEPEEIGERNSRLPEGLTGDRAIAFFRGLGYTCGGMRSSEMYPAQWRCTKGQLGRPGYIEVDVFGINAQQIRQINVLGMGDPNSLRPSLAAIAEIPYQGARPAAAKAWVEQNISAGAETDFGGVFYIVGGRTSGAKQLRIGRG
jgi:hypothetical protein